MINNEIKKREEETKNGFIHRVFSSKIENNMKNSDCRDVINRELGTDYAESSLRGIYKVYEETYEEIVEKLKTNGNNEEIDKLEEKILELKKERVKTQDQRREYNKLIRTDARFEHLVNIVIEETQKLNKTKPLEPKFDIVDNDGVTEAIALFSDWHLYGRWNNNFGRYDCEIAKRRIEELIGYIIAHCRLHKVSTLHVELLGDNISGRIHQSSQVESEEDVITQAMGLCEVMGNVIFELSKKIENVKVYSVIGNHARIDQNKKNNQKGENLERLVPWFLKHRLEKLDNVEICTWANIDDTIVLFDVLEKKIVGVHGDLDNPSVVVNNMIKMLRVIPDEIHSGHLHHHLEKEEYEIETVQNGSLGGTDTYASDIRKTGRPMQKLRIYNEQGLLCSYKIKLTI